MQKGYYREFGGNIYYSNPLPDGNNIISYWRAGKFVAPETCADKFMKDDKYIGAKLELPKEIVLTIDGKQVTLSEETIESIRSII